VVKGTPRALDPAIAEDVGAIVREAIANAFKHASATSVTVTITYAATALRITVSDDGRGIDAPVLLAGGADGHWGMPGMRERAARIRSQFSIGNRAQGSAVELNLNGARAWQHERRTDRIGRTIRRFGPTRTHDER
jgi:signal transduction histidine kinase